MFFSVVIPTLNEQYWLPRLLEALARQSDRDFEVIVVDCGSTDQTKRLALEVGKRLPSIKFLETHSGISYQKNFGSKQAQGTHLLFFDADVVPEDRFIEHLKIHVSRYGLQMATVWNRADCSHGICKFITRFASIGMSLFQFIRPAAVGTCIMINRAFYEKIGGFDEEIIDAEDWELTSRAAKLGAKFKVFRKPLLWVSGRRFEKVGLWNMVRVFIKIVYHSIFMGGIRRRVYEYKMGGSEFEGQRPKEK